MKKIFVLLFVTAMLAVQGQNQNQRFRTDTLKKYPIQVSAGYAVPNMVNITNAVDTGFYVKFYDQTAKPISTSIPIFTLYVQPNVTLTLPLNGNLRFNSSMWIRQSLGWKKTDTTINTISHLVEIFY